MKCFHLIFCELFFQKPIFTTLRKYDNLILQQMSPGEVSWEIEKAQTKGLNGGAVNKNFKVIKKMI